MRVVGWLGHIRWVLPAFLLYLFIHYGSEALLNHQPLEAWALFARTSLLAVGVYVLATIIRRLALGRQENLALIPFVAFNLVGLVAFTVTLYLGAVLVNHRCTNEPAKAHMVMAVEYVYARIHTPASVKVKDWGTSGAERWLSLQPNQIQQFNPPALVTVFIQPGAFGYDWLLDIKIGAQPLTNKDLSASLPPMPQLYCWIGSRLLGQ